MANSDYIQRGSGAIAPTALLQVGITPGDETLSIRLYTSQNNNLPAVGDAVMLNDEIMVVKTRSLTSLTVGRGCADSAATWHDAGSKLWFFGNATGSDRREYLTGETIGVKVLMKTSGGSMEAKNAPPNEITFGGRANCPYLPAQVKINGTNWWERITLDRADAAEFVFTWVPRNRKIQADVLLDQTESGVTAEAGTTYNLRFYSSGDTLLREITGITGLTATYTYAQAITDLGLSAEDTAAVDQDVWMYASLESERDGTASWSQYIIEFPVNTRVISGWGGDFGNNWGG